MSQKYFNWKLALVLIISFSVVCVTANQLHKWQKNNRSVELLQLGTKAYNEQDWDNAAKNLGTYISIETGDVPVLTMYAKAQLNRRPSKSNHVQLAINAYRIILRADDSNAEAAIELTKLYLAMNLPEEAELIAKKTLEVSKNPELNRILALSLAAQKKIEMAALELKNIIAEHPDQILAYESLCQLTKFHPEMFSNQPIVWLDKCVSSNSSSALAHIIRAAYHVSKNNRPDALADLAIAEKLDLHNPDVRLHLARTFMHLNMLDKATKHLKLVKSQDPTSPALWKTWIQLGVKSESNQQLIAISKDGLEAMSAQPWDFMPIAAEMFIKTGQHELAEKCISKLNQKNMNPATIAFLEGLLAESKGSNLEAIKHWQKAIQLDSSSTRTHLILASLFSRLGNVQSALWILNTVVARNPDYTYGHIELAKLSSKIGDWAKAAKSTQIALQLSPGNLQAATLHCQALVNLLAASSNNNDLAWSYVQKQLAALSKATNNDIDISLIQFQAYLNQKKFSKAHKLLDQLKNEYPSQISVDMSKANLLIAENKTEKAISLLGDIITEFPDSAEPVEQLAISLAMKDDNEKCEQVIRNALKHIKKPEHLKRLHLLLAELYARWDRQDDSYKLLDTVAKQNPYDIMIKHKLLECRQVTEDRQKSQHIINEIKQLEGDQGWQWKYEQAKFWFTTGSIDECGTQIITLLKENLLFNPSDLPSLMLLAATYEKMDNLQLAISTYRQALDRSPGDIRIIIPIVATLHKANEYEQAEDILNSIPNNEAYHPVLSRLQLQSYLRYGQLDSASNTLDKLLNENPENQSAKLTLALLKMQQKKYDKAKVLLDEIKAHQPDSILMIAAEVKLNILIDENYKAIEICDQAVKRLKSVSAYILRANTYSSMGRTDKAIEDFDQAVTIEPKNSEVWMHRSDFYRKINQPGKAIADIKQALELDSNDMQIKKRAITLFIASKDITLFKEGQELLSKALSSDPEDTELLLVKAHLLISKGTILEKQEAIKILEKLTDDRPEANQAWALLGNIMLSQGKPTRALDAAMRGLSYKINDKDLLLLKARAEAARSTVLAIPTYQMLREFYPDDFDIVIHLAKAYIDSEQYPKAENLMIEQLDTCKDRSKIKSCNITLSIALYKSGKKNRAEKKLDQLLNAYPDDNTIILAHTELLAEDKQWSKVKSIADKWFTKHPADTQTPIEIAKKLMAYHQESLAIHSAENILKKVIDRDHDNISAMQGLAMIMQMTDRCRQAIKLNHRILAKDPENLIAMNNMAWMLCEDLGKYQQALNIVEKGLNIVPGYTDMIDTRGIILYRMGRFNESIQDFNLCIEMYPSGTPGLVSSYFHLGKAFAELKENSKAIRNLKTSLYMANRIGGLSPKDLTEAHNLIKTLQ